MTGAFHNQNVDKRKEKTEYVAINIKLYVSKMEQNLCDYSTYKIINVY